jgi:two-component system, chemotaxis family, CheB/CheR fusion protein
MSTATELPEANYVLDFPVVAIGASAGGLEALQDLFAKLPDDMGCAFVIITHQLPDHPTLLPEILAKYTTMTVREVTDYMRVEVNYIYISTPGHRIKLQNGHLILVDNAQPHCTSFPIDYFLRSLASEMMQKAICIILSGMGDDGTQGLQLIKDEFGLAIVQVPTQAKFDGMPSSAISTGLVDFVLPVEKIAEQLIQYLDSLKHAAGMNNTVTLITENLEKIFVILRAHTGNDFSSYKKNTLCRRIERRMNLHLINDPVVYIAYLEQNPQEAELLFKELLIGVTCFFRDAAAFELLSRKIFPELLKGKNHGDRLRLWVAGCSTGEEVYSIAILLQEYMEQENKFLHVQIYGTDLDNSAICHARRGLYSEGIELDISPQRLKKYFTKEDSSYRIKKNIREMVVFAVHNIIQDPSFTKLDFISCRNLMIYMGTSLQKQLIPLFHYSLNPKGILFLGSSETIGVFGELFHALDLRWKIFLRREAVFPGHYTVPYTALPRRHSSITTLPTPTVISTPKLEIADIAEQELLRTYVPPAVIVNSQGDVLFIHGRTGLYLEPAPGNRHNQNILVMAREGLKIPLSSLIREVTLTKADVTHSGIRVQSNDHTAVVNILGKWLGDQEDNHDMIMIIFETAEGKNIPSQIYEPQSSEEQTANKALEREFAYIKKSLQLKISELEVTNEELRSANEELQSTNEELQSVTEELETSREELQSLNEELYAVNTELEIKNNDLAYAHDDMTNLLNSTGIATIFLDSELNIKRFNMQAKKVVHLIACDVGRPLGNIATELEYNTLIEDARNVLETLVFKEVEVRTKDGSWYLMRILPYRTAENVIDGIAITFVDVSKIKRTEFLLATHDAALELLAKGRRLTEILEALLQIIEEQSPDMLCSVMLLDKNAQYLRHVAAPSMPEIFKVEMDKLKVTENASSPAAIATYLREPLFIRDIEKEPQYKDFYPLAKQYNLQAAWSQPIFSMEGKVFGAFTAYFRKATELNESQKELIMQVVHLLGITISQELINRKFSDFALEQSKGTT